MHEQQHNIPSQSISQGRRFLDQIYQEIHQDPLAASRTMSKLLNGLQEVRREMPRPEWQQFCKTVVPRHGLVELIHQDPFTLHSVRKPRGYPGDAALLDYIYGHREGPTSPLGKSIFDFTTNTPPSRAVRSRARTIAGIIDRLSQAGRPLRILSIACGHLREADMSEAVREGKVGEYVAFDQDAQSLALVNERLGMKNVQTIQGSIGDLLMGRHKHLGGFDFVYAAGLYDYLSQRLATRMTSWMFNATRPGGVTLLTNFLEGIGGAGYMEAFMEWELIFRTPEELFNTTSRIPKEQVTESRTYVDEERMVVFVEVQKAMPAMPLSFQPHQPATTAQRLPTSGIVSL